MFLAIHTATPDGRRPGRAATSTQLRIVLRLTFRPPTTLREPNSKPDIQDIEGLQASAMWVRRALQRAEPRALIRI